MDIGTDAGTDNETDIETDAGPLPEAARSIEVQVLERVRQVGPNKEGAKGSFTIYHLPA